LFDQRLDEEPGIDERQNCIAWSKYTTVNPNISGNRDVPIVKESLVSSLPQGLHEASETQSRRREEAAKQDCATGQAKDDHHCALGTCERSTLAMRCAECVRS